jgi:HK97 family phage major capsid protein
LQSATNPEKGRTQPTFSRKAARAQRFHTLRLPPFLFGVLSQPRTPKNMAKINELLQERNTLITENRSVNDRVMGENRAFRADEQESYDKREVRIDEIDSMVARIKKLEAQEGLNVADPTSGRRSAPNAGQRTATADPQASLRAWLMAGRKRTEDGDAAMRAAGMDPLNTILNVDFSGLRANQSANTGSLGGDTVGSQLYAGLEVAAKQFGNVRGVASHITTTGYGTLFIPTSNDTSNEGEQVDESAAGANQNNVPFGQVALPVYKYSSGQPIRVPFELLQDSAVDIVSYINSAIYTRLLRIENRRFTTGNGTNQVLGLTNSATLTQFANGAGNVVTAAITADGLIDLQDSLEAAYDVNAQWMFPKATLSVIRKLKDGVNNYIFSMGSINIGTPDTLLGKTFTINQQMDSTGVNTVPILYGDFSKYLVRTQMAIEIHRLNELYIPNGQIGFIAFMRSGGVLVDAGTHPVVGYQLAQAAE